MQVVIGEQARDLVATIQERERRAARDGASATVTETKTVTEATTEATKKLGPKVASKLSSKLVGKIDAALRRHRIRPDRLVLEITEDALIGDVATSRAVADQLRLAGIRLWLDDFGTGYSSLSYLKKFPIDIIKIDRSFISEIPVNQDDMEITSAVIAMAHNQIGRAHV